jgi:uncharacterized protein with beta-barrel porin domain
VLTPFVAGQATTFFLPGYSETSSGSTLFALSYGSQSETPARTELGAQLEHGFALGDTQVKLTGRAAWAYNARRANAVSASFQALPGSSFTVVGAQPGRNAAIVDAGAEFAFSPNVKARIGFQGEFSNSSTSYGGNAKLTLAW